MPGLSDAVELAAGWDQAYSLQATGAVSCWGFNGKGQVGDTTTIDRNTPTLVTRLADTSLTAGASHLCDPCRRASRVLGRRRLPAARQRARYD